MSAWLGVVCADHVTRGVQLGIAQTNHGRRTGIARMRPGDWFVYYSPHQSLRRHSPLQAFTAIGRVEEGDIWQADEGTFKPWRRRVAYLPGTGSVPLADLRAVLDLTASPTWGHQLRRGLVPLTAHDVSQVHHAMTGQRLPIAPTPPVESMDPALHSSGPDRRDAQVPAMHPQLW